MSIFIDKDTRLIVQGITGKTAKYHTELMLDYGTQIVAGTSPGKKGTKVHGINVYNTVKEAKEAEEANTSIIYVPPRFAYDAIIEGIDAELENIICITEHIPVIDMIKVKNYLKGKKTRLIGPNCPGIITPGEAKIGIMPGDIHKKGNVGIVSRSGTLTYEAVNTLTKRGIGQSTAIGIGGDPIIGTNFIDVLDAFNKDDDTDLVVLIGEIGGTAEEEAAKWIKENMKKKVVGFISGKSAPKGKRMGHAGAIISSGSGSAEDKVKVMEECNISVAETLEDISKLVEELL